MTQTYLIEKSASELTVGDKIHICFNVFFDVLETHRWGKRIDVRVFNADANQKMFWRYDWDEMVVVEELA